MNDIADLLQPLIAFRRDIHAHPELGFAEHRTAQRIAEQLREIGLEVHEGIGGTGIVAVLRSGDGKRTLGLRADMDALPIEEQTNAAWSSTVPGCFHGCGHDGHVAMLLGAAQVLARDPGFSGTLNFIFQPAEEGLGGARHMIEDGLFDRFDCERVYALHNWPGLPAGTIATRPGAIMGAADKFKIILEGKGGHAALPQDTPDTILAAASLVQQLNSIIGRDIPPSANAVLSVTEIAGGHAHNVLPASVRIGGTVRSFDPVVQDRIEERMRQMIKGIETSFEVRSSLEYDRYYPATINDTDAAGDALDIAATVANAQLAPEPAPTSEDFSFMLQERPGAYLWLGQGRGDNPPPLHNPHYDFNDDVMETGIRLHVALARHWLQD
ncbi:MULTISPECIES: M20 aminoacylase family protein [unclassified Novosphingobium]|uniref:M20 aminoacylase family protein n=1 Tax=unclassified Novosphingobium TaxID=2644732 RepID=UPI00020EFADB|nr:MULTISPECIES: M20 aminoacylase family protein [unclassified Novosphingobium]GFM28773.1 hippurate hydrolase [Novosphingobium sp. PY1]CCA90354.1 hippurate hydrolase [Novosphingobium sp. PP1Y]